MKGLISEIYIYIYIKKKKKKKGEIKGTNLKSQWLLPYALKVIGYK